MLVIVCDRESIERGLLIRSSFVVISIYDPDKPTAKVRRLSGLRDVLCLPFHDAEPIHGFTLPEHVRLMTTEQAQEVCRFVERYRDEVGAIVVHCEQGMSRSPAVAAAIASGLGQPHEHYFEMYQPNQFVFRLLTDTFREQRSGSW